MIKEAVGFGDTLEEAKEDALIALGASADDDVQFDVIERPKKKVLGVFGGSRAKVRVFIELPDVEEKAQPKAQKENNKKEKKQPKAKPQKVKEEKTAVKPAPEYGPAVDAASVPADSKAEKAVAYTKAILEGLGYNDVAITVDRKSTRLNSSHKHRSRMPSSA